MKNALQIHDTPALPTVEVTPQKLLEIAVQKGADLEKLEKLMGLQERWEQNEAKKAYHAAMSAFKAEPPKIFKDAQVGYATSKGNTNYKHATLGNVSTLINTALSKHGLSASWKTEQAEAIRVTCCITHVLGHQECTSLQASPDTSGSKNQIQAIGSTVTYLQRYTILALTGLATHDQDDDGKSAEPVKTITEEQQMDLIALLSEKGRTQEQFCKMVKIEKISDLVADAYEPWIKKISEVK